MIPNQMESEIRGYSLVDALEKAEELLVPMPRLAPGEGSRMTTFAMAPQPCLLHWMLLRGAVFFHVAQVHG